VTVAKSGHCYLDIKDDRAVINSIIWKGVMGRLSMRPEEGMDVVVEGKMTTYPGRSNYQLVIEKMELAGAGALMALFEQRKKKLAAEGLFDKDRKVELPFMPKVIGVVTSPTGAVIRDILHRITDRFPVHVIVWPVLVQGDKAAEQVTTAINGFNHSTDIPRPDVLIVARGGGSMEDLWCFNEENVARAAAASKIPMISAIGHETDWTLIDYVVDYRAPTPTGAAEVAVPVRADWLETVEDYGLRLARGLRRNVNEKHNALKAARLPRLQNILSGPQQRLDLALARLPGAARLLDPLWQKLGLVLARLAPALNANQQRQSARLSEASARLRIDPIRRQLGHESDKLSKMFRTADMAVSAKLERHKARLSKAAQLLDAYSYQGVLDRGYAMVTNKDGHLVRSKTAVSSGEAVTLTFADGKRDAVIDGGGGVPAPRKKPKQKSKTSAVEKQQDLF